MGHPFQGAGVHQYKSIQPSPSIIQPRATGTVRLNDVGNSRVTVLMNESDSGFGGHILEEIIRARDNGWGNSQRRDRLTCYDSLRPFPVNRLPETPNDNQCQDKTQAEQGCSLP